MIIAGLQCLDPGLDFAQLPVAVHDIVQGRLVAPGTLLAYMGQHIV